MIPSPKSAGLVRFESFELNLETCELRKNGRRIRLQDQPGRLLTLLASRPGELVTRGEIQKTLWEEGRFVEFDQAVNTAIKKVREALGDDPDNPRLIETLPRKGYRFIAAIEPAAQETKEVPSAPLIQSLEESAPSAFSDEPAGLVVQDVQGQPISVQRHSATPIPPRAQRTGLYWVLVALPLFLVVIVGAAMLDSKPPTSDAPPEIHVEIMTPPTADPTSLAISPDGLKIVFVAIFEGRSQLRLRHLGAGTEHSLPGTDGALFPFWSPNSRSIAFFADGALKRTEINGGMPRSLAEAPAGRGGAWNSEDVILFTPNTGGPIFRVTASGETAAQPLTQVSAGSHRHPRFLPDGRHFLYFVTGSGEDRGVYVGDLAGSDAPRRLVLYADAAAEYAPSKRLLFVSQGSLFAQEFDPAKAMLGGSPFRVADQVTVDAAMNLAAFSVSTSGSLVYRTGSGGGERQFIWFDRRGRELERVGEPEGDGVLGPSMSPDGRHIAMYRTVDGNSDIWLLELERGVRERFTIDTAGEVNPVWSRDRRRVAFSSNRDGAYDLYVKTISSSETELLLKTEDPKSASSWSPDGRHLLFRSANPVSSYDIWALPFDEAGKPGKAFPVVQTEFEEREAEFSPNGKWIAYQSTESGRSEVYVQPFPAVDDSILLPVSTNGGAQPRWGKDSELFYIALDGQLISVPIGYSADGREIRPGMPVALFPTRVGGAVHSNDRQQYAVSPDGNRFLMNTLTEANSPIAVVLNWKGES
jgi:Tol biopolymer transport system component/DNA-binding winged helix-turn-helix (wHTH) protein